MVTCWSWSPVPRAFSLSRREADIAVTVERPREGRLVARKLVDYRLGLYAAPAYLEAHGSPSSRDDLARHRLVGYVEDLIFSPSLAFNAEFSRDWRSSIAVSSALGQIAAVRAGAGIGVLHAFMAHADPGLVPVLPETTLTRAYGSSSNVVMSNCTYFHFDLYQRNPSPTNGGDLTPLLSTNVPKNVKAIDFTWIC